MRQRQTSTKPLPPRARRDHLSGCETLRHHPLEPSGADQHVALARVFPEGANLDEAEFAMQGDGRRVRLSDAGQDCVDGLARQERKQLRVQQRPDAPTSAVGMDVDARFDGMIESWGGSVAAAAGPPEQARVAKRDEQAVSPRVESLEPRDAALDGAGLDREGRQLVDDVVVVDVDDRRKIGKARLPHSDRLTLRHVCLQMVLCLAAAPNDSQLLLRRRNVVKRAPPVASVPILV